MIVGYNSISQINIDELNIKYRLPINILKNILEQNKRGFVPFITGSFCSRIVQPFVFDQSDVIIRDKFSDIDYLILDDVNFCNNIKINNFNFDCINYHLKEFNQNIFYNIDSSVFEVILNILNGRIYATDGYIETLETSRLMPPNWHKSGYNIQDMIDIQKEYLYKPFYRCLTRGLSFSDEMIDYMNKLIEQIYINERWFRIQAIIDFNYNKYEKLISEYKFSSLWNTFFKLSKKEYNMTEIADAYSDKYQFILKG